MRARFLGVMAAAAFWCAVAGAAEWVTVAGSGTRFATSVISRAGGKPINLALTGTALRKKYGFSVYSVASYVEQGKSIPSAEMLGRADVYKMLHLVFERDVDGATMARSFRDSIGRSHPAPAFSTELGRLEAFFVRHPANRGDHILLTSIPGTGLVCQVAGKGHVVIPNPAFAQAAWGTYFGPNNLGVAHKNGLSSRLR